MSDIIQKLKHSTIQHGLVNQRIYLMKLEPLDLPGIIPELDALALQSRYQKILAKIPGKHKALFSKAGYGQEGLIRNFFRDRDDALFMTKYFSSQRKTMVDDDNIKEILSLATNSKEKQSFNKFDPNQTFHRCRAADAHEMSQLFKTVFKTYPFPVFDPRYLIESMNRHSRYFCVRRNGRMISIAAAEIDYANQSVEMTDFATLSKYRGQGLASYLLKQMECEMLQQGMRTLFSIARALSPAMNITFANYGYLYGGTLINNTNISGRIESMNVWYKHLKKNTSLHTNKGCVFNKPSF
jgi:putative beta-lysine N-acetyltransferase